MEVFKDNILVEALDFDDKKGSILISNKHKRKLVNQRLNCGRVVAVSEQSEKYTNIGDVVGYSTLDGVDIKVGRKGYILLSKRETQAIIKKDHQNVLFGEHHRDEMDGINFMRITEGKKGALS